MKTSLVPSLIFALFLAAVIPATANTFTFQYTGLDVTASGIFTADPFAPGVYAVTGMTGERNGSPITSFIPSPGGPGIAFYYSDTVLDNLFYMPSSPRFFSVSSQSGVDFGTVDGKFNIYFDPAPGAYVEYTINSGGNPRQITFAAAEAPEPSSMLLLGTGLTILGMVFRRKRA